jgi:hypothetical protein
LPALCNGVLIVSEDVPLKEEIPYGSSIMWAPYEYLTGAVMDVQENYENHWNNIFDDALKLKIQSLHQSNIDNLVEKISFLC